MCDYYRRAPRRVSDAPIGRSSHAVGTSELRASVRICDAILGAKPRQRRLYRRMHDICVQSKHFRVEILPCVLASCIGASVVPDDRTHKGLLTLIETATRANKYSSVKNCKYVT
jgi:hypothetical protein